MRMEAEVPSGDRWSRCTASQFIFRSAIGVMMGSTVGLIDSAEAAPITFSFDGIVKMSNVVSIPINSIVHGHYTFDSGLIDSHPDPKIGLYRPVDLTITFVDGSSIYAVAEILILNDVTQLKIHMKLIFLHILATIRCRELFRIFC